MMTVMSLTGTSCNTSKTLDFLTMPSLREHWQKMMVMSMKRTGYCSEIWWTIVENIFNQKR